MIMKGNTQMLSLSLFLFLGRVDVTQAIWLHLPETKGNQEQVTFKMKLF